jgi:uncharacterized protein YndB with AHSA1/START domain
MLLQAALMVGPEPSLFSPPPVAATPREEIVDVEVSLPVPPVEVWRAITAPEALSGWFGTLRSPLAAGQENRLDFGDGDFFDLVVLDLKAPACLRYSWRFMGTSPPNEITWRLDHQGPGCRLSVTDHEPGRSLTESIELGKGWADFLSRLHGFLTSGRATRYDWRDEIDVSIEIPAGPGTAFRRLLSPDAIGLWLPLDRPRLENGTCLLLDHGPHQADAESPILLRICCVKFQPPAEVSFLVEGPERSGEVPTQIAMSQRPDHGASHLYVHQAGWKSLRIPDEQRRDLRVRSAGLWVTGVRRALRGWPGMSHS